MPIRLGRIAGIPIALDYSWFVIFFLITWSVGFAIMPAEYPGMGTLAYAAMGLVASFLLFASILVHELAHSVVARRNGLKIGRITLFLFGGVSEMQEEPKTARLELKMALAGPLTSVALAAVLFLAWQASLLVGASVFVQAPLNYGAFFNGIIAAFNLIPAFPMDGGRVLRSLIWWRNKDILRSTEIAAGVGKSIAYVIMFLGLLFVFGVDIVSGLWLILIGWFISSGAQGELRNMVIQEELSGRPASDIMTRRVDAVPPEMKLEELQQEFLRTKHNALPVVGGGELLGCATIEELHGVRRDEWATRTVSEIMTPRQELATIAEGDPALKSLQLMGSKAVGRVFVLSKDGRLGGIITRGDVIRTLQHQQAAAQRGGALLGGSMTVEPGMNFILEQPSFGGARWKPLYDGSEVQLLGESVSKHSDGREYQQFVFQALRPGVLSISLAPEPTDRGGTGSGPARTVRYTISVTGHSASTARPLAGGQR